LIYGKIPDGRGDIELRYLRSHLLRVAGDSNVAPPVQLRTKYRSIGPVSKIRERIKLEEIEEEFLSAIG